MLRVFWPEGRWGDYQFQEVPGAGLAGRCDPEGYTCMFMMSVYA